MNQPAAPLSTASDTPRAAHVRLSEKLALLQRHVPLTRRIVHEGDTVFRAGDAFSQLHIISSGTVKIVALASDGREQVSGFHFQGDWLGFEGIARGRHLCDAVAMDTGEIWSFRYEALLHACAEHPALLGPLHEAMSRQIVRDRDSLMSLCTLPADARVADFLLYWVESLSQRGLRADEITLRLTRAEIGNYLGMKLETVSRAMSRLARDRVIEFRETGRRAVRIPDPQALGAFIQRSLAPAGAGACGAVH